MDHNVRRRPRIPLVVRTLPLGQLQTNCFLVSAAETGPALIVDPGDDATTVARTITGAGLEPVAILVTHAHFDHIGAVAPIAHRYGVPVYAPAGELSMIETLNDNLWPGFGPYETFTPDVLLDGGERLLLAGLTVRVLPTPGHSPAGVSYAISGDDHATVLMVGDVLFRGSIGRTDFAGGSFPRLERSILSLYREHALETVVFSGHSPQTTLADELRSNPFLGGVREVLA